MTKMLYPVPNQAKTNSHLTDELYREMYQQSIESPDEFWQQQSAILDWYIPVSLEAAALLAALTHPNHLVRLSSWG
jgi:hypothetical protein|tara:strand:- start:176 stop:403 length:228 start_codon:yes stop_codon:yes gene_type:complete